MDGSWQALPLSAARLPSALVAARPAIRQSGMDPAIVS